MMIVKTNSKGMAVAAIVDNISRTHPPISEEVDVGLHRQMDLRGKVF